MYSLLSRESLLELRRHPNSGMHASLVRATLIGWSGNRSHLLIDVLNVHRGELHAALNVPETNNMISNMTSLEAAMSREFN